MQVANEPLNTHLTSLPNHVGSLQSNGQQQSSAATIPNGKSATAAATVANKIPTTCTSTSVSSPNSKQSMVSSPAVQSPGGPPTNNKKHSPTISNLLAPTSSTNPASSNGASTNATAVPSPVSSTSSLSSISMPSRLGSSTPPVVPASSVASLGLISTNTPTTTAAVNSTPSPLSVPVVNSQAPHLSVDANSQSMPPTSNAPTILPSPASLSLPPTLNGPGMPPLMGLGGMPMSPLSAPPYRAMYPSYGLYPTYGLHPHPYGIPPSPIPSPALSPRTAETRRDSSLVLSKPVRPVTPNSNSSVPTSSNNSSTPSGPNSFHLLGSAATNSPRGYSPTRERDNYRFVKALLYYEVKVN